MNRIQTLIGSRTDTLTTAKGLFGGRDSLHTVFAPQHYERNYAYPLIIWLHGPNDSEQQLLQLMPHVSMRNYVGAAPRGTRQLSAGLESGRFDWCQEEEHILLAEQRVVETIQAVRERLNIASNRIFLAGLLGGGTMALRIALNRPELFAGVLAMHAAFPRGMNPLRRYHEVRRLQLFLVTGRHSLLYPQHAACADLTLIHTAGISVNLRQYPCGDDVTSQMLGDMNCWIMGQLASADNPVGQQVDRQPRSH